MIDSPTVVILEDEDALRLAAHLGNVERCRDLLAKGFEVDYPRFWTPFRSACSAGRVEVARLLLEAGARLDCCVGDTSKPLVAAIKSGSVELCELLIAAGANILGSEDLDLTPLMEAAKKDRSDICKLLVEAGADIHAVPADVEAARTGGWTALHLAAALDSLDALKFLLAAGADPSLPAPGYKVPSLTAFQVALRHNSCKVARYFLFERGEDPNQRTVDGETMMQVASQQPEAKELLRSAVTAQSLDCVLATQSEAEVTARQGRQLAL